MRVLLDDDADALERYVRAAIEPEGWVVERAANGADAIAKAISARPDTILLDFVLPDVDGLNVLEELFAAGVRVPTIVLSGAQSADLMRRFASAGAVDYLAKEDMTAVRLRTALRMAFDMRVANEPDAKRAPTQRGAPGELEALPLARKPGGVVLVIDDTESFRALVRIPLALAGWRVLEAADGEEALALAQKEDVDVILLDQVLPDTDGLELLEMLRVDETCPPVIALTGHGDEILAEKLLRAGAVDYLPKETLTVPRLVYSIERAMWLGRAPVNVMWTKPRG